MELSLAGGNFFIIDSDHLDQVQPGLYGYFLDENGITTNQTYKGESPSIPNYGAYVIIRRCRDIITIEQDFFGKFGLYVFESGDRFVLSNSFLCLVDYLKTRHPLSLDKEFADYLLVADLVSVAYGKTLIREIRLLDRNATATICLHDKSLTTRTIVPPLRRIALDSKEGIRILDNWYYRWTRMLRNIAKQTTNITADLSGGFDTRIGLMLLICAGVDLHKINIDSFDDDRHTHREDFTIASQIANHYGFNLNDESMLEMTRHAFSEEMAVSMSLAVSLGFSKMINRLVGSLKSPRYRLTGAGGEAVRGEWNIPVDKYLAKNRSRTAWIPKTVRQRFADAQELILKESLAKCAEKYLITDPDSSELPQLMHMEEWVRNHFGKDAVETWLVNDIKLSPLLDQDLNCFRLTADTYSDNLLLISVILHRYCPELLQFPFDSGRSIDPQTDEYGAKIAARYPMNPAPSAGNTQSFLYACLYACKKSSFTITDKAHRLPDIQKKYMKLFNSDSFQRDFRLFAGREMDCALRMETINKAHNPLYHVYSAIAIVEMMHAVWESRGGHGSDGLCDRPGEVILSPSLRIDRGMLRIRAWARKHIIPGYKKFRKTLHRLASL